MLCPSCGNEVPARPTCLRCGAALFGDPALPATALGPSSAPLSPGQRMALLAPCVPVVGFGLMVALYLAVAFAGLVPAPPPLLYLFVAVVLLITGYTAVQSLRDLAAGVALVQEDLLSSSYASRGGAGPGRYYGRFERLGTLRLAGRLHFQRSSGQRYRVTYSPASKVAWALDPPDARAYAPPAGADPQGRDGLT